MKNKQKEYHLIVVNPERCVSCEACMSICSFIHETEYIPLIKRIIGKRVRIEEEWAISCDLCMGMKEELIDAENGMKPQCIDACLTKAIFISTLESFRDESRMEAISRAFKKSSEC